MAWGPRLGWDRGAHEIRRVITELNARERAGVATVDPNRLGE